MELSGKVFKVLPVESGEGKNGIWKKQQIVIETAHERYPKKVAIQFWGDLVENSAFAEGKDISVEFDVESREFNGRWYTDVKAWRINTKTSGSSSNAAPTNNSVPEYNEADAPSTSTIDDDLPF